MKKNMFKTTAMSLVVCAACLAAGHARAANLVANGDFESGDFSGWLTTSAANGSFYGVDGAGSHQGAYSAYFGASAGAPDSISQTLATVAGQQYLVSFLFEKGPSTGAVASFTASLNGVQLFAAAGDHAFGPVSLLATAGVAGSVLSFSAYNTDDFYTLDNVSVTAVPEPATQAMLALGLMGLTVWLRQRRDAAAPHRA